MALNETPRGTTCPWRDGAGAICGGWITKDNCATHLARYHGIKDMSSGHVVKCQACNHPNPIKRENILRHFVEVHIGIKRKPCRRKNRSSRSASLVHGGGVSEDRAIH